MKHEHKKTPETTGKVFTLRFSKTVTALAIGALALSILGVAVSVWRIAKFGLHGVNDWLQSPFLILICIFCVVLVASILARSRYIVTDEYFITQFGFIRSKFSIKEITSVELDSDTKKLTVYMGETQFFVLSADVRQNDALVTALREKNSDIEFTFTLAEKNENE